MENQDNNKVLTQLRQDRADAENKARQEQTKPAGQQAPAQDADGTAPQQPDALPLAIPARMKRRHWGLLLSFLIVVVLPVVLVAGYLWLVAEDRYLSMTGFTVRQDEGRSGTELIGGLAQLAGASPSADGDVLYEFIRSQEIVARMDEKLDLKAHYSAYWSSDPVFALWPDASIEDLHWYWERVVRVSYDQGTGLTDLQVFAFSPDMARDIARAIVDESQEVVNRLNAAAREDAIRYADEELDLAVDRLKRTRQALTEFRTRTQIVDLEADIQGRMGVMSNLQQQLAQELVEFDELTQSTRGDDPRVVQALRRIQVIRERINQERADFANTEVSTTGEDYPTLISEFEALSVDREFAEEAYRAALAARDQARVNAERQSRYLAAYIAPTLAETSEYPRRFILLSLAALFASLSWGILALVYYSVRDRG